MSLHIPLTASRVGPDARVIDAPNPAAFIRGAFEGVDGMALVRAQLDHLMTDPTDAAGYMNLGVLYQLIGRKDEALACQEAALLHARLFREAPYPATEASFTLLVFVAQGDLMTNTPIELLLEGRPVQIVRLYVDPDLPLPETVPEHDLAMIAISESDQMRPLLERLKGLSWPRPVINPAAAILDLSRDRLWPKLEGIAGLVLPPTTRVSRAELARIAAGEAPLSDSLPDGGFPMLVRPVGSHAGQGLSRIKDVAALSVYLRHSEAETFYLSRFIDYAGADGRFRKYRVAMFDGRPYLAHMAIGDHWMVHYLNAGMASSVQKRAEEAAAMAGFDQGFARRHAAVLDEISRRLGLDYYALDCAETPDGALLVFEADVGMIVHALDSEALYPYKQPQMQMVFAAFEAMLRAKAAGA
jgi:glutathione synthase/RimK-type ligase-like ATP-grasp enzyme